ncbi:EN/SPM-LIKE TRANSPOSON-RELATED [Salix purpurea]|uniref:EN/SPM-LIKE TRANSPOSON-RELATED n=1 Tax=Salix purpurea TaxID=77065 RepID=A0A9Q0ZHH3_SALPP|nr:EN/SPM-LIKE TRANSPOSON-RELATED [Salix purpurea]
MNCNLQTDLAHHNPFTIALKNFSHKTPEKEKVNVDISRDDKLLSPSHLEKEYEEWILEMHSQYDTRIAEENGHVLSVKDGELDIRNSISIPISVIDWKGFNGLYIFSLGCKLPDLFKEAGVYTFLFTLSDKNCKKYEKKVTVKASRELDSIVGVLAEMHKFKKSLSSDKLTLKVQNVLIVSNKLDRIQPKYEATLVICPVDELIKVSIPCQVMPGSVQHITGQPPIQEKHLLPGFVVKELVLEMLDAHDNHVGKGLEVQLNVDGFCILDKEGSTRKVTFAFVLNLCVSYVKCS